ncbi:hypothetical protein CWO85_02245 [Candidatus Phytoplasma ziziphi]|uniref:Uncharacterized protein n=1 Tax=Ziziphus jujuba witches'-broom phytoplasma TaxID=135727 RepID=A0A660HMR5_ZIZJU|nr:hypothetical protein [Candidatus Phytoplasma ziziphi]AYJ01315.1 hypothetical protein CWO85_02245 [Candidatus Phytoplasma ziziphi]
MFINKLLIFLIGVILGAFLGAILYNFASEEILKEKFYLANKDTLKYQIFKKWFDCINKITEKINEWLKSKK